MQLDDHCGKLRSVELLNAAGRSLRVNRWLVNRCPGFDSALG